jgi:phosphoglycerol transferase
MRNLLRLTGEYGLCALLSAVLVVWLFDLPHRDLGVPFDESGDALDSLRYSKTILDHGWVLDNPDLGAPHGASLHDYLRSTNLLFLSLKVLGLVWHDPFRLTNLFFLLAFPLTALVSLAVLRHFRLAYWPALTAGLLYAFLPYHSLRNLAHLYLATYYVLPLVVMVVLWVFLDEPLFGRPGRQAAGRFGCTARGLAAVLVAVAVACTDVYYGFFTCFFLLTAGLAAGWRKGGWLPSAPALLLLGVVTLTTVLNFLPQFAYRHEHGANFEAGLRASSDAEHYALRLSQMLVPTTGHRVPLLRVAKYRFNAKLTQVTESDLAALGALGSVGLLYLLGLLLVRPRDTGDGSADRRQAVLHALSVLSVAAILVGGMGGLSLLIASAFPYIRCYNRLSVFVGFFAVFALAHLLERLTRRLPPRLAWQGAGAALCLGLAALGAWEQTPASMASVPPERTSAFHSDRDFVYRLERRVQGGALVFQLPYATYPEGRHYDHLRLYLHSHSTRWSFGAMRGRYADLWQRHVSGQGVEDMAATLCWAGFAGVCWDRWRGTREERVAEARWQALLGEPVLVSEDKRVAFYPLDRHAAKLRRGLDAEQVRARREEALYPVLPCWGRGFQQVEDPKENGGRWSNRDSELLLFNPSSAARTVRLDARVRTAQGASATLRLESADTRQEEVIDGQGRAVQVRLTVPPGRSWLRFHCDAAADPQHERRVLQVIDCTVRVAPLDAPAPGWHGRGDRPEGRRPHAAFRTPALPSRAWTAELVPRSRRRSRTAPQAPPRTSRATASPAWNSTGRKRSSTACVPPGTSIPMSGPSTARMGTSCPSTVAHQPRQRVTATTRKPGPAVRVRQRTTFRACSSRSTSPPAYCAAAAAPTTHATSRTGAPGSRMARAASSSVAQGRVWRTSVARSRAHTFSETATPSPRRARSSHIGVRPAYRRRVTSSGVRSRDCWAKPPASFHRRIRSSGTGEPST